MNAKDYLKKVCVHTAIYFTCGTLLLLTFLFIMSADVLTRGIPAVPQLLMLPFSMMLAIANVQFRYASLSTAWRVTIHALLTVGGLFLLVYLPNQEPDKPASVHFGFLLGILLIYAVVMGIFLLIRSRTLRVKRDATHYKSIYKNKNDVAAKSGNTAKKKTAAAAEGADGDKQKKKRKSEKQSADEYESVFKSK